jgi:hypothetical protein
LSYFPALEDLWLSRNSQKTSTFPFSTIVKNKKNQNKKQKKIFFKNFQNHISILIFEENQLGFASH